MDLWESTRRARWSLLSTFEVLEDDDWEVPSLCEGWIVREVLAHLTLAARPPLRRYAGAVARARGSFDRANHALAVADARQPVPQLVAAYRDVIDHRFSPPGWPPAAPYSDILLHSLDVRIPLGREVDQPADAYPPVLELLLGRMGRSFTSSGRPQVRWVANDLDWAHGDGPGVEGTMEDLALAAGGRSARLDRLAGDGVELLRTWLR